MTSTVPPLFPGCPETDERADCDVLLIEDDEDCRDVVCYFLRSKGYGVRAVASGADALLALAQLPSAPALILLDLVMPGMSGFECLDIMRQIPRFAAIPVVVHSGRRPTAEVGVPPGVERWLVKPVRLEVLLDVAREFVR